MSEEKNQLQAYKSSGLEDETHRIIQQAIDGTYTDTKIFNEKIKKMEGNLDKSKDSFKPWLRLPYYNISFIGIVNDFINELLNDKNGVEVDTKNISFIKHVASWTMDKKNPENLFSVFIEKFLKKDFTSLNINPERLQNVKNLLQEPKINSMI